MKAKKRSAERMKRTKRTAEETEPIEVPGHHLLCAVCVRGGCKTPPPGKARIDRLLKAIWDYPFAPLRVTADLDVSRAHYRDAYAGGDSSRLPRNFARRTRDYADRLKDLNVCRVLGILPNTVIPAFLAYRILFDRQPTLDGMCRTGSRRSKAWPQCPHASRGYYEKIASGPKPGLKEQTEQGELMDGQGLWAMVRPRTREDMLGDKRRSADYILHEADHLYIRAEHCLCILCAANSKEPLIQDNLIELLRRMEDDPSIPVTLVEGCCMVCDPCNVYHPGENLCYHCHVKCGLRDLMLLERIGVAPGATLPAGKLYELIYKRIETLKDVCGWQDGLDSAPYWAPCAYHQTSLQEARKKGLITGKPMEYEPPA